MNTEDSSDPKHLYLLANVLKDVYHGDGSTIVITDGVVSVKANVFADKTHTHTESDITDLGDYSVVGHKHTESDITDLKEYSEVGHTHTKSEITDFSHNHDERYYTESEVDAIIDGLNNRLSIDADKTIIQTDDKLDVVAYRVKNGVPQVNKDIFFYIKEDVNNDSEL